MVADEKRCEGTHLQSARNKHSCTTDVICQDDHTMHVVYSVDSGAMANVLTSMVSLSAGLWIDFCRDAHILFRRSTSQAAKPVHHPLDCAPVHG